MAGISAFDIHPEVEDTLLALCRTGLHCNLPDVSEASVRRIRP
jgi:hypothetical protein